jgi:hypothetical protein
MLPDYPEVKSELLDMLVEFLKTRITNYLGPLSEIPRSKVFEEDGHTLTRSSGEREQTNFQEYRAGFRVSDEELPTLRMDSLLERLDKTAEEMARQQTQSVFSQVSEAVERVGNVVDAEGKRISAQVILDVLSKMHVEFNSDLTPQWPTLFIPPGLSDAIQLAQEEYESDPELKKQFSQLVERKREEWRAREASRKLVG